MSVGRHKRGQAISGLNCEIQTLYLMNLVNFDLTPLSQEQIVLCTAR